VSSFEDSEELQVFVLLEGSSSFVIDIPVSVVISLEVSFAAPVDFVSPSFTTSPVANEIFVS
jgi:hypothetical protein